MFHFRHENSMNIGYTENKRTGWKLEGILMWQLLVEVPRQQLSLGVRLVVTSNHKNEFLPPPPRLLQ